MQRSWIAASLRLGAAPAAIAVAVLAAVSPAPAAAQTAPGDAATMPMSPTSGTAASTPGDVAMQEVIVTGSRIARRDFEANSPIVTANETLLKQSSTAALETNLNKLPQFTPAQSPTLGGDTQPRATSTPGAATISLRGLGTNRNLVLFDGRRATPSNALQVVDINTLPGVAIERVEIITGGASAVYGADAVAGVVNFIPKKNFSGLQLDGQMGVSQYGDQFEYRVSGIMGTNFADNRGNVSIAMETNRREDSKRIDRPWFRKAFRDPSIDGSEFFPDFPAFQPYGGINPPSQAAVNALFPNGSVSNQSRLYFNNNGTAFTGFFQSPPGGASRFNGDLTGLKWKRLANGQLGQNFLDELLILPLNRYNIYARGNYDVTDNITVFGQGLFSKVTTRTTQQPSPAVNGWSALIPRDGRQLPAELNTLLNSRANPNGDWQLTQYLNFANRSVRTEVFTYNMVAGVQARIPDSDWSFEFYGSQGESQTAASLTGYASLARYRAVVTAPNWGRGFSQQGNPLFGGFGASSATCTSGLNPFSQAPISADCIAAISADLKTKSNMQQTVWEGTASGSLFSLPAGEVKIAVGADYRANNFRFEQDTLTTQGSSFLDQAIGVYPSGNSRGKITVKEAYGELLVPILKDMIVKSLDLELGGRVSEFNTTGTSYTYKALADLQLTDWFRVRGGYNRAERAPNIAELFLAPEQSFAFASGDPCSTNSPLTYSANPRANPGSAAQVRALCSALMNRTDPNTATNFYNNAVFQGSGGVFAFPTLAGNPNLKPEKADTWTAGIVLRSPIDSDLLRSFRVSVDYYDIRVKDAIGPQSIDIAQRQCLDRAFNPTFSIASPFCAGVNRVAGDGAIGNVITTYFNNGRFHTSGIDAQLDWAFDVGPGRFSLNSVVNYLISMKSAELANLPLVDFAGSLGPNQNGLTPGAFRWKMLNTFGYGLGPVSLSLQWQHLPKIASVTKPILEGIGVQTTTRGNNSAYDLFNLAGTVKVTDQATLRFGIDNMFNKAPPVVEVNTTPAPGTLAGGDFNDFGLWDLAGRRFFVGANFKF